VIVFFGLVATGLVLVLTVRRESAHRWGRYVLAAVVAVPIGFFAGISWFNTVECTAYSYECDLGPFYGIMWAISAAVGCLVIGGVIEIVLALRDTRDQ